MPLPRFQRLPEQQRQHILAVARRHLAQGGPDAASYNQIIVDAGISKTSAYLYFDGKDDLVDEVIKTLYDELTWVLADWKTADTVGAFWEQLKESSDRLRGHLASHPDDLALLARCYERVSQHGTEVWFERLLENGMDLGVIRADIERPLLIAVTIAVFRAIDSWALEATLSGRAFCMESAWSLLQNLWAPLATVEASLSGER